MGLVLWKSEACMPHRSWLLKTYGIAWLCQHSHGTLSHLSDYSSSTIRRRMFQIRHKIWGLVFGLWLLCWGGSKTIVIIHIWWIFVCGIIRLWLSYQPEWSWIQQRITQPRSSNFVSMFLGRKGRKQLLRHLAYFTSLPRRPWKSNTIIDRVQPINYIGVRHQFSYPAPHIYDALRTNKQRTTQSLTGLGQSIISASATNFISSSLAYITHYTPTIS